jgi:hypothetical protein
LILVLILCNYNIYHPAPVLLAHPEKPHPSQELSKRQKKPGSAASRYLPSQVTNPITKDHHSCRKAFCPINKPPNRGSAKDPHSCQQVVWPIAKPLQKIAKQLTHFVSFAPLLTLPAQCTLHPPTSKK